MPPYNPALHVGVGITKIDGPGIHGPHPNGHNALIEWPYGGNTDIITAHIPKIILWVYLAISSPIVQIIIPRECHIEA